MLLVFLLLLLLILLFCPYCWSTIHVATIMLTSNPMSVLDTTASPLSFLLHLGEKHKRGNIGSSDFLHPYVGRARRRVILMTPRLRKYADVDFESYKMGAHVVCNTDQSAPKARSKVASLVQGGGCQLRAY